MSNRRRRKNLKGLYITFVCVILLLIAMFVVVQIFTIQTVVVNGSTHYTDDEIEEMIIKEKWEYLSFWLSFKYQNKTVEYIPFVESIQVSVVSPDTVKIEVYEKKLAGYVMHLGEYVYFDNDGIVVEVTRELENSVPLVTGITFDQVVLHEPLPTEDTAVFLQILEISNLLEKYELSVDKIYFDSNLNMTLYMYDVRILLGDSDYLYEKIMCIRDLENDLSGMQGVLDLENYTSDTSVITFSNNT
ncbi:MAG: FtsQ-type POTRA domain-containing protein [Lachnospiraceae bacterium]